MAQHITSGNRHVAAGRDVHPPFGRSNQGAGMADLLDVRRGLRLPAADGDAHAAVAEHARLPDGSPVGLEVGVDARIQVHVTLRDQQDVPGAGHLGGFRVQVPPCGHLHRLATKCGAHGPGVGHLLTDGGRGGAEHLLLAGHRGLAGSVRFIHCDQVDVAAGGDGYAALVADRGRRREVHVAP